MSLTDRQSMTDPDGVRWNMGAWFGSQIGGSCWMLTAFAAYVWQSPGLGVLCLGAFAGVNALGFWLWAHREQLRLFRCLQLMIFVCGGLAILAVAALDFLPQGSLKHDLIWRGGQPHGIGANRSEFRSVYLTLLILIPALLIQFEMLGRQARRRLK